MSSKVAICNYALSRLGAARITDLTDNTREGRLCNSVLDQTIDEVLVEGPWSFAVRRVALNLTTSTPSWEYLYEFQLPTNPYCLRVIKVDTVQLPDEQYSIEGDKLLANINSINIKYIARITDAGSFTPMFEKALKTKLAAVMSYTLTGKADLGQALEELYQKQLAEGLAIDGQQGGLDVTYSFDLHEVRYDGEGVFRPIDSN